VVSRRRPAACCGGAARRRLWWCAPPPCCTTGPRKLREWTVHTVVCFRRWSTAVLTATTEGGICGCHLVAFAPLTVPLWRCGALCLLLQTG
jgi:hypothetical protein